jgi:hypothetical protein
MPTTCSLNTPGGEVERAALLVEARHHNKELKAAQELEELLYNNTYYEALLNSSTIKL